MNTGSPPKNDRPEGVSAPEARSPMRARQKVTTAGHTPVAVNRDLTAAETRAANALLREVMMDAGSPSITNPLDMLRGPNRDKVIRQVRAVIRSLYEPDDVMLAAYMGALEQPADPHKEPWHKAKMRKRWRAMIDAASPEVVA